MKYATAEAFEDGDLDISFSDTASKLMARLFEAMDIWRERRKKRRHLYGMSEHLLRDIGLSRGEAMFFSNQQFWGE